MQFELRKLYYYPASKKIIQIISVVDYFNNKDYAYQYKLVYPKIKTINKKFHCNSFFAEKLVELTDELKLLLL